MTELLTSEQIKQTYAEYLCNHKAEIDQLLSKKIETAIKSAINQAFATGSGYNSSEGWARKLVSSLVDQKIELAVDNQELNVDLSEIQDKVNASVKRHLNKLNVKIDI
ncbi:hypothetical protein [Levilactobacillus brevis]|uniref:hypothetical protein n=1 Tax=Levilactobacillus brevis TaxID=1580 RepID=UPI003F4AB83F